MNKWWFVVWILVAACGKKQAEIPENEGGQVIYTCSMDPQVKELKPGKCPICKMELTKIIVSPTADSVLHLNQEQEALAQIEVQSFQHKNNPTIKKFPAVLAWDENYTFQVATRVAGRVEKLTVKSLGQYAQSGESLYYLFSQPILSTQQELLNSLTPQKSPGDLNSPPNWTENVKNRLRYMGVSDPIIETMANQTFKGVQIPFYPSKDGIVTSIDVKEGDYVSPGQTMYTLSSKGHLWAQAIVYPSQVEAFNIGSSFNVQVEGESATVIGKVESIRPELENNKRFLTVNIRVIPRNETWKPGMKASVWGNKIEKSMVTIPMEYTVLRKNSPWIWVKNGNGSYRAKALDVIDEKSGLFHLQKNIAATDSLVTKGIYWLESEWQLRKK